MIDRAIELDRPKCRKAGLKQRDVIEREAKEREPVDQPITGQDAERQHLVNAWGEQPIVERAIEVVWNVKEAIRRGERP